ncbi:MAG: aspartate-alanine antiporter [Muribaculaceae bacterium]|nr:aspartate-alanine antiporter [Muribaculaceae bacterium]
MFESFADILREYPTLALFLTIGLGFLIGKIKIGNFSLGSVTSVLLVGVIIGQLEIPMSGPIKMVFFMMFLFSIGYSVGPDFFRSLRGGGLKQAMFALIMGSMCFGVTWIISYIFGYSKGETIGLFSGSQTCSALLGVGTEALGRLGLPKDALDKELNIIPVCYAVTYIFGTLGTVIILGNLAPRLLGGIDKVKAATLELEKKLNSGEHSKDPAYVNAMERVYYRAYLVNSDFFNLPRTVHDTEKMLRDRGLEVYVDRLRHEGEIKAPRHDDKIFAGDEIVICGRSEFMVGVTGYIGEELADPAILAYPLDRVGVVVKKNDFIGKRLSDLRKYKFLHGVVIRDAYRSGAPIDINLDTTFEKGDRLTIVGRPVQVKKATSSIGHEDRPSIQSDLMFVGLAIFIGGLFGTMSIYIGSIPVSFGTSGGALIAGLVFGWLRSKRPTYGHIPQGALWLMNNLGLNVFIAVVGIEAAPSFVSGIKAVGPMLFVAGAVGTMIPVFFGLWLGHKVFKFNPAITLGCCAGTRTCTAALGAAQSAIGSTVPAIGYAVTYAVSNIMLVIWGLVTVLTV